MSESFPRQLARTRRFTLGEPRDLGLSPDGRRLVFARSRGGDDPVNCLWVRHLDTGEEQLVADPAVLLAGADEGQLPPEERARRERAREAGGGVVAYATDAAATVVAFALDGRLFVGGLLSATARELVVHGPVFDPRPDPLAARVAYVSGPALRVAQLDGRSREVAGPSLDASADRDVTWGSADFIAAEEMDRTRGFWWAPDGLRLAVERVDTSPVGRWWIADAAQPGLAPREIAYPAAGTDNAIITLHVVDLDGGRVDVNWDHQGFPYLAAVSWTAAGGLLIAVQSRDQRNLRVLRVEPDIGTTSTAWEDTDDVWAELVPGTPAVLDDGRLVVCADREGARRLLVDGTAVTPPSLQVRAVVNAESNDVVFTANDLDEPTEQHVWRWSAGQAPVRLTHAPGIHTAIAGGGQTVIRSVDLDSYGSTTVLADGAVLASHGETPIVEPNVTLRRVGERSLATAVLVPAGAGTETRLPVLLDPYGGPHAQRVQKARGQFLTSQWFADQGFAVVVIDGRGTPGRGRDWERAVHLDLAGPVLEDQIDGLRAAAAGDPRLDLSRVAIRGWSFGGYVAALAVLRRPDIFHAAVAGAPVTDWRLYDTHYTERYLGDPNEDAGPYERSSLLVDAGRLERPLLLIHGLADDNVVSAHTFRLSSALLAAGRPHDVLPLSGVTHMTPQEVVAENLLLLQLDFLQRALGLKAAKSPTGV